MLELGSEHVGHSTLFQQHISSRSSSNSQDWHFVSAAVLCAVLLPNIIMNPFRQPSTPSAVNVGDAFLHLSQQVKETCVQLQSISTSLQQINAQLMPGGSPANLGFGGRFEGNSNLPNYYGQSTPTMPGMPRQQQQQSGPTVFMYNKCSNGYYYYGPPEPLMSSYYQPTPPAGDAFYYSSAGSLYDDQAKAAGNQQYYPNHQYQQPQHQLSTSTAAAAAVATNGTGRAGPNLQGLNENSYAHGHGAFPVPPPPPSLPAPSLRVNGEGQDGDDNDKQQVVRSSAAASAYGTSSLRIKTDE